MRAKQFCVLTATESRAKIKRQPIKMHLRPPVAKASARSNAVVLLLLIYYLMYFLLLVGVPCLPLFCYALLCVHSSFAIILKWKRKLVALHLLSNRCFVTINVLWLFLTVPLVLSAV